MDISKYTELKAKGNINLVKIGESFALVKKQYDVDTGEAIPQTVEAIGKDQVLELQAKLQSQLEQIDEVLKDIAVLNIDIEKPIK